MALRPARLLIATGVSAPSPAQQAQSFKLVKGSKAIRSLASLQFEPQGAAFREIRIVVEPRDLQPSKLACARVERRCVGLSLALKHRNIDGGHARDFLRGLVNRAEKNGLAEREVVGMKDAARSVGQRAIAEDHEQ